MVVNLTKYKISPIQLWEHTKWKMECSSVRPKEHLHIVTSVQSTKKESSTKDFGMGLILTLHPFWEAVILPSPHSFQDGSPSAFSSVSRDWEGESRLDVTSPSLTDFHMYYQRDGKTLSFWEASPAVGTIGMDLVNGEDSLKWNFYFLPQVNPI